MIAECLILLSSFAPAVITDDVINEYRYCQTNIPSYNLFYFNLIQEHFEEENWNNAVKISWCESRGNAKAVRTEEGNFDSGLFQFIEPTWNWIADEYDLPRWDEYVITYRGYPWNGHPKDTQIDTHNYKQVKAQLSPYYNILFASILAEDIYNRTQWRDWSSSKSCWKKQILKENNNV